MIGLVVKVNELVDRLGEEEEFRTLARVGGDV